MIVSSARAATLAEFSLLEAELSEDEKYLHAEDVEIFLQVLFEEATNEGRDAYWARMEGLDDEDYPWTAVRARHYWEPITSFGDLEKLVTHAPPAISLAFNRRPDLEPELPGDEIPDHGTEEASGYDKLYNAWFTWDANMVLRSAGPLGWAFVDDWDEVGEAAGAAVEEAKQDLGETAEAVGEAASETAEQVWEKTKDVAEDVGEAAKDVGEKVFEAQKQVAQAAGEATWQIVKPLLYVTGGVAAVGVVGLIVYAQVTRPKTTVQFAAPPAAPPPAEAPQGGA
ncbi:MAG: YtxH domain-containing protein [Myxococcales bacterium]|nr:YtxH domain-containing protein [Myxococcales bacterium]